MRQKPEVCKHGDKWYVIKPVFGFRNTIDYTEHDSWLDAMNSMCHVARQYAAGGGAERKWTPTYDGATLDINARGDMYCE